jgi:signal transduction histidine kinase
MRLADGRLFGPGEMALEQRGVRGGDVAAGVATAFITIVSPSEFGLAVHLGTSVVLGFAMALRNRWPIWCYIAAVGAILGGAHDTAVVDLAVILTGYAVTARTRARAWYVGLATAVVLLVVGLTAAPGGDLSDREIAGAFATAALLGFLPVGLARIQRQAVDLSRELAQRNVELERLRLIAVDQAVMAERNRIARDLHDVVAHHVSAISLRARGAQRLNTSSQLAPELDDALDFIGASSTDALAAMRAMVLALRESGAEQPVLAQPTLGDLTDLLANVSQSGVQVTANLSVDADRISPSLQLCAYRIAQEALTNATKHSDATEATVDVRANARELLVEITDNGRPHHAPLGASSGFGLVGMKERVVLLRGSFQAGPTESGGWRVLARLPLDGVTHGAVHIQSIVS